MDEILAPMTRKPARRRLMLTIEPNKVHDVGGFDLAAFMGRVLRRRPTVKPAPSATAETVAVDIDPAPLSDFAAPDNLAWLAAVGRRLKPDWAEYLQTVAPHRGIVLYHGGAACAAFAHLEGVLRHPDRKVVVLLNRDSDSGFVDELAGCSRDLQAAQRWGYKDAEWQVLPDGAPNFEKLSPREQQEIETQLRRRRDSYMTVCYPGFDAQNVRSRLRQQGGANPFDRAVVVVEDAHAFARRIAADVQNAVSPWTLVYSWLLEARGAKVVALAEAPSFDRLSDLGVLYNFVYGYTPVWSVDLTTVCEKDELDLPAELRPWVQRATLLDKRRAAVVRTPEGFKRGAAGKLVRAQEDRDDKWFKRALGALGTVEEEQRKLLPDSGKWTIQDEELQRRLAGLTAYTPAAFAAPAPNLRPHTVQMSEYQETVYAVAGQEEGRTESALQAVGNFVYPQAVPRPEETGDYRNKVADAAVRLDAERVFTQLKQYSPKYAELLKGIEKVRRDGGGRQLVYFRRLEDAFLFSRALEHTAAGSHASKPSYQLATVDAKKEAEAFNAADCTTELFLLPETYASKVTRLDRAPNVHFMEPVCSLVAFQRVLHLCGATTAHVYLARQAREGSTVDEKVYDLMNKKMEMAKRWTEFLKKSALRCKSVSGPCSLPEPDPKKNNTLLKTKP